MGLFSSSPKPPTLAQMPTCQARIFQKETEEMSQTTRVANQLATETFNALGNARALRSNKSLSASQHGQVCVATAQLKEKGLDADCSVYELRCFNRTFDRWGAELAKKHERQGGESRALLNDSSLQTKEGYTPENLRFEVVQHRERLSNMAGSSADVVADAIRTLNEIATAQGAPHVFDVSATWRKAANPASW